MEKSEEESVIEEKRRQLIELIRRASAAEVLILDRVVPGIVR